MIVWAYLDKSLCEHMLFISIRYVPRKGMARSYAKFMFYYLRHCQTIAKVDVLFYILTSTVNAFQFPHTSYTW